MNFRSAKFITSAVGREGWPDDNLPEVVMIGRSNVGKSTLINLLVTQKIAKVSSRPGHTKTLNFFLIDKKMRLVDAPGHGYAGVSRSTQSDFHAMMGEYLAERTNLKGAIVLLDGRREPSEDDQYLYKTLLENEIKIVIVITKSDKLNQSLKVQVAKNVKATFPEFDINELVYSSTKTTKWIDQVHKIIGGLISK
jgi:GTP-binding protein